MTENTKITTEKLEEIRQRYRPTEVPKCHICGAEMTIQRMSASRITYGCAGAIYDETGCHYAEGRSLADDHYAESRITVVDVSDPDVLALVEALEKAENTAGVAGMAESYETTISMLKSRISELEESHAQVIQSRDHYKRMTEEGLKQLAESRTVTVKLPKLKMLEDYLSEVAIEERKQILVGVKLEFHRACVAAGIKVAE